MSLEKAVHLFAKLNKYSIVETDTGFEGKKGRVSLEYLGDCKDDIFIGSRSFALDGVDESTVTVLTSPADRKLFVNVRYGCLRDYIHQLHGAKKPVAVNLRERYQLRLEEVRDPLSWI